MSQMTHSIVISRYQSRSQGILSRKKYCDRLEEYPNNFAANHMKIKGIMRKSTANGKEETYRSIKLVFYS